MLTGVLLILVGVVTFACDVAVQIVRYVHRMLSWIFQVQASFTPLLSHIAAVVKSSVSSNTYSAVAYRQGL